MDMTSAISLEVLLWIIALLWLVKKSVELWHELRTLNPNGPVKSIGKEFQVIATELVDALDDTNESVEDILERDDADNAESPTFCKAGKSFQLAAALATLVKLEVGTLKPTQANKMVVERMVVKIMRARFMRPCDQLRILPSVVTMVFTPTDADIVNHHVRYGDKLRARMILSNKEFKLYRTWTEWFWGCSANRGALEFKNN